MKQLLAILILLSVSSAVTAQNVVTQPAGSSTCGQCCLATLLVGHGHAMTDVEMMIALERIGFRVQATYASHPDFNLTWRKLYRKGTAVVGVNNGKGARHFQVWKDGKVLDPAGTVLRWSPDLFIEIHRKDSK